MSTGRGVGAGVSRLCLLLLLILLGLGPSHAQEPPPNALQQLETYIHYLQNLGATDIWIDAYKPVFQAIEKARNPEYLASQSCVNDYGLARTRLIAGAEVTCAEGLLHAKDGTQTPILVTFKLPIPGVTFPEIPPAPVPPEP